MGTETRWTPTDWLKLVALVGGFCLFALGAWILHLGIAAERGRPVSRQEAQGHLMFINIFLYLEEL